MFLPNYPARYTILLNRGVNVDLLVERQVCAPMAATTLGKASLVQQLTDIGVEINDGNDKQPNALHSACASCYLNIVNLRPEHGADVNARGGKDRNVLNVASSGGFLYIVDGDAPRAKFHHSIIVLSSSSVYIEAGAWERRCQMEVGTQEAKSRYFSR